MENPSLARELIDKNRETHSPFLDLGNCGLYELPEELGALEWLETVNFGKSFPNQDGDWLTTENKGRENRLVKANWDILGSLPKLRSLFLDNCGLERLPLIKNMTGLRVLSAQDNQISGLDDSLALFYPQLDELYLEYNIISDIDHLTPHATLTVLALGHNRLTDIRPLEKMTQLVKLSLNTNKIPDLGPLEKMSMLDELRIENNYIDRIDIVKNLSRLSVLNIAVNQVSDLSPLQELEYLTALYLAGNQIEDLTPLSANTSIEVLDLTNTPITRIEPVIGMKKLEHLMLSSNPIEDCPPDVWQTSDIRQIRSWFESQKKTKARPSVKGVKPLSVKSSKTKAPERHDVKLILVGNSGVGKTQLSRYLVEGTYTDERLSTHGIRLDQWQPDDPLFKNLKDTVSVNIWDFGGQEYYHGAYRLFLSNFAVYVLLWDGPTNVNDQLETPVTDKKTEELQHYAYDYWLENIRHYAPDSTILMVQNKIDLGEGKEHVSQKAFSDFTITWDYYISLKKAGQGDPEYRRGYDAFCTDLSRYLAEATRISEHYPRPWIDIRDSLKEMLENRAGKANPFVKKGQADTPWMYRDDFESACLSIHDALTSDDLHTLPRWFHNSGLVIYFGDNPKLEDRVFFDPEWVTRNIYDILNQTVLRKKGEFSIKHVEAQNPGMGEVFVNLMKEMELVFEHRDKPGTFIAPQYLPIHHPVEDLFAIAAGGLQKSALTVRLPLYFYRKVMLKILYYFGASDMVKTKYYWRNGILFVKDNTRVLVKGYRPDPLSSTGLIVIGTEDTPYRKTIQKEIFHHTLNVLEGNEWLLSEQPTTKATSTGDPGLPNRQVGWTLKYRSPTDENEDVKPPRWLKTIEISTDGKRFVSYLEACFAAQDDALSIKTESGDRVLLKTLEPLLDHTALSPHRVFLSYSHADSALLNRLKPHLALLKRMKQIESWSDQALRPGDPWDDVIREKLEQADIIILLLTADFFASDYIWDIELKTALDRSKSGKARLVPILMKPFDYESLKEDRRFKDVIGSQMILKAENEKLLPVTLWENQEQAFEEISKKIRDVIKEDSTWQ